MGDRTSIERGCPTRISGTLGKCIMRSRIGIVIVIPDIILSLTCNFGELVGKFMLHYWLNI
jgi:hypothetical protein